MTGMLIILLRGKIEDFGCTGCSGQRANFFFFFFFQRANFTHKGIA